MTDVSNNVVVLECAQRVATITLNRPEVANAINAQIREQLPEAVSLAERDKDVRVILLRGAGKGFSAGADIAEFQPPASGLAARAVRRGHIGSMCSPRPVSPPLPRSMATAVAAARKIAELHIRIAADNAVFGLPEVSLAIIPGRRNQRLCRSWAWNARPPNPDRRAHPPPWTRSG